MSSLITDAISRLAREWLQDNSDRCCHVQAFGAQVEHWFKAELAMAWRPKLLAFPEPHALELERKPRSLVPDAPAGEADMVVARPDGNGLWPGKAAPRYWIELKMRTHFTWNRLEEDLGKWRCLPPGNSTIILMYGSYRHRVNGGGIPSHRAAFEGRTGLRPLTAITNEYHGIGRDGAGTWAYNKVTHCLYLVEEHGAPICS